MATSYEHFCFSRLGTKKHILHNSISRNTINRGLKYFPNVCLQNDGEVEIGWHRTLLYTFKSRANTELYTLVRYLHIIYKHTLYIQTLGPGNTFHSKHKFQILITNK